MCSYMDDFWDEVLKLLVDDNSSIRLILISNGSHTTVTKNAIGFFKTYFTVSSTGLLTNVYNRVYKLERLFPNGTSIDLTPSYIIQLQLEKSND